MATLNKTKELLETVSKQNGVIPGWMAKDALKRLDTNNPDTERTEAIIKKLNESEKHPALADKIRSAEDEIKEHKKVNQERPQKRGLKL
ncbi:hypothetical protein [Hahella ganghwensis]|uniref:hypothetical protein n=1 Tax=Hahella ganghwensis TaxID=286420 RepID=UPI000373BB86|nr:hypothetical protein [Hahella ganghwensis]